VEESLIIGDFITADMSGYYLWTLNYRRQMSHCTLAQGEDVGAAERIATALRDAGIEVWFDRSELRGGFPRPQPPPALVI